VISERKKRGLLLMVSVLDEEIAWLRASEAAITDGVR
jgi:hypothetical protein